MILLNEVDQAYYERNQLVAALAKLEALKQALKPSDPIDPADLRRPMTP